MKRLDPSLLHELSARAAGSARRRKNYNLHSSAADPVQRRLNAFEPTTYSRPYRHGGKWELFVIVSGSAAVVIFGDNGRVRERADLNVAGGTRIVEIPEDAWHTVVSLSPQTVMFEVKVGPYVPTLPSDFALLAPAEDDPGAAVFERWFQTAAVGDIAPSSRRM